jgi:hypothetical protein
LNGYEHDEIKELRAALQHIKSRLGYGIYGCPTDREYHKQTYVECYEVAKKALGGTREEKAEKKGAVDRESASEDSSADEG